MEQFNNMELYALLSSLDCIIIDREEYMKYNIVDNIDIEELKNYYILRDKIKSML